MASRVNVKFVVLLSVVLGMVFLGVAGALVYVKFRSGERNARLGEQAAARGDWVAAEKFYSRAVAKDQTNVAWLKGWRDAMLHLTPDSEQVYSTDYRMLMGIEHALALAQ